MVMSAILHYHSNGITTVQFPTSVICTTPYTIPTSIRRCVSGNGNRGNRGRNSIRGSAITEVGNCSNGSNTVRVVVGSAV